MRINIWIVLAVLLALLATTRLLVGALTRSAPCLICALE